MHIFIIIKNVNYVAHLSHLNTKNILNIRLLTHKDETLFACLVCSRLRLRFLSSAFLAFFFFFILSPTPMNSAFSLIYINLCVNSNSEIIFLLFSIFKFQFSAK